MTPRPVRALGWLALLGLAVVALRAAATGQLAAPPLTSLDALEAWIDVRGPIPTAIALVRLVAELAAWYLLALSVLHVLAGLARLRGGHAIADALASPSVRRLVHGALGLSLIGGGTGGDGSGIETAPVVEMLPGLDASEMGADEVAAGTATMRPLDARQQTGTASTATMRPLDRPQPAGTASMTPVTGPRTWPVHAGESFWEIADAVLEATWGRPPSDHAIDPYWRALVDANRERLVDPDDPDLIVPGQVFELPPVPPAG